MSPEQVRNICREMFPIPRANQNTGNSEELRFVSKLCFGDSECWYWRGFINRHSYGIFSKEKAHRASWRIFCGPIPDGISVLHKCDIRFCVNPNHLFLGTQLDNMRDCATKGRIKNVPMWGEENPMAKLTQEDVFKMRKIRDEGGHSYRRIADQFNVSSMTAYRAIKKQSWSKDD